MKQLANPIRLTYGYAYSVAFMPDGKTLMIGTHGGALLWDFHRRRIVRDYYEYAHPAEHIAVTPDGLTLVTASAENGQTLVWNIADATMLHRISADTQGLWWMAVSPCGRKLLACGKKDGLRCWDMRTGEQTLSVPVRTNKAWRAAWSPCGRWIAHSSGTRRVRVVAADSGTAALRIDAPCKEVTSLAFHPDGRLFTGLKNGTVQIWDVAKGRWKEEIACRHTAVDDIIFSRDGQRMLERGPDKWSDVHVTDLQTGQRIHCQRYDSDKEQRNVDLSPDGQWWAGAYYGFEVGMFRTGETKEYRVLADDFGYFRSAQFTPDGKAVLIGNHKNGEALFRVRDGARLWSRHKRESYGETWGISPDGRWMVSGLSNGEVVVRDMKDGHRVAKCLTHENTVSEVRFQTTGNRIVTVGEEGAMAQLHYSMPRGKKPGSIELLRRLGLGCMNDAKLSSDGKTLVTASSLGIQVWNAESEKLTYCLRIEKEETEDLFISPDSRFAVALSGPFFQRTTAHVLDLHSGQRLHRIRGTALWGAAFSPDGRFFCLCDGRKADGKYCQVVQARGTLTGKLLWTTRLKDGRFPSFVVTPDGSKVVVLYARHVELRCGKDRSGRRRYRHKYAPTIRVLDARTGRKMVRYRQDFPAAKERPSLLSEGTAPSFLSVENGEMQLRNALDATMVKRLSLHAIWMEGARLSPDGKYIYLDGANPSLWDTTADQEVNTPSADSLADPAGSTPRQHVTHTTEYVSLKDLSQQTIRTYCLGHYSQYVRILPFPDGERVLVVGDGQCALWNPDKDTPEWTMWFAQELYRAEIRVSPDGSITALGLRDKSGITLITSQTGRLLRHIDTPEPVSSVAFSPDGTRLMSAHGNTEIRIWDVSSGAEVLVVSMDDGTTVDVVFYTPDGNRILAYCTHEGAVPAKTIRIMDACGGTIAEFPGEPNYINYTVSGSLSPDGLRLLTEERDAVFLWDISGL